MAKNQKEKDRTGEKSLKVTASSPDKKIPKYANRVIFNQTEGNIVMIFLLMEKTLEGEQGTLIESIVVDKGHAKMISEVLSRFIEEGKQEESKNKASKK